jgi:Skp family chaperone for outer membrane proteins
LLSSVLGLLFLLLVPLHINNVLQARTQALQRINQEVTQAENQLQTQIATQQNQFKNQIGNLLQNEQQFNQTLQSNQVPEQIKTLLRQAKANPASLDQLLAQQLNTVSQQERAEIQRRKQEIEQKAQQEVWQTGVRIGIRSLLLSIGYIAIAWIGLRGMRSPTR